MIYLLIPNPQNKKVQPHLKTGSSIWRAISRQEEEEDEEEGGIFFFSERYREMPCLCWVSEE